jgi:hypothetical protein
MANKPLGTCPVCGENLNITRFHCTRCDTTIEGHFDNCKFCLLDQDQQRFVETFIRVRGNIKEMERELGISYPTVRNRLDAILEALGYEVERSKPVDEGTREKRQEILDALNRGELSADEATRKLRKL